MNPVDQKIKTRALLVVKILFYLLAILVVAEVGFRFNLSLKNTVTDTFKAIKKNQIKIITLSDSVGANYPSILEAKLNADANLKTKYKIVNLSKPGGQMNSLLFDFNAQIEKIKPDIVIILIGVFNTEEQPGIFGVLDNSLLRKMYIGRLMLEWVGQTYLSIQTLLGKNNFKISENKIENDPNALLGLLFENHYYPNTISEHYLKNISQLSSSVKSTLEGNLKYRKIKFLAYLELLELAKARQELEEIKKLEKDKHVTKRLTGFLEQEEGNYKAANKIFEELENENPVIRSSCLDLGKFFFARSQMDKSDEKLKSCLQKNDNMSGDVYSMLGKINFFQNNISKAKEYYNKAIIQKKAEGGGGLWDAYWHYSLVLRSENKIENSMVFLTRAIDLNPNYEVLLSHYFDVILAYRLKKENYIRFLKDVRKRSVYRKKIDTFIELCENPPVAKKDKEKFISSEHGQLAKFRKALLLGMADEADNAFLEIENSESTYLNQKKIFHLNSFFELMKRNHIQLVISQVPNQTIEPIKQIIGKERGISYFDSYSYFKDLISNKKFRASDLFTNDATHLTDAGSKSLAEGLYLFLTKAR